jgi:creatinine amidohydrolase
VLLSTHGGNAEALARVTERLREEGMSVLAWSPRWGGDAHAGRTETSVMLALRPESVRLGDAAPGNARRLLDLMPALRAGGVAAVSPNGILGDPTGASAEEGRALLSAAADDLAGSIAHTIAVA